MNPHVPYINVVAIPNRLISTTESLHQMNLVVYKVILYTTLLAIVLQ